MPTVSARTGDRLPRVEGYKAFSKGRFIGPTGECTIYEEGARRYWGGVNQ